MKNEKTFIGDLTINDIMYAQRHDLSYGDMVNFKNEMDMILEDEILQEKEKAKSEMISRNSPQETTHFAW